jgi:hypothetical protein
MFTDIYDSQLTSEMNTCITLVNLYQKQMMMMEYYDEINDNEVFQEAITSDMIENADTSKMVKAEAKGAVGRFFERIWSAIKKFFEIIKNFFKKLFKKDDAKKVAKASNNIGDFFTNATEEEIDELIDNVNGENEKQNDGEGGDDTQVSEMFVGEGASSVSQQIDELPKNTPAEDKAYLKKALLVMKAHRGFIVSRIDSKNYEKYAKQLIGFVKLYVNDINGYTNAKTIDIAKLVKDSKSYKNKIKSASAAISRATKTHAGNLVTYKGYEQFYRNIMSINMQISEAIAALEKSIEAVHKNIDKWQKQINTMDNSKFGVNFANKKYINDSKKLNELYVTISDIVKDLTTTAKYIVAGTMKSEVEMIMCMNNEVIKVQKTTTRTSKKKTTSTNEENNAIPKPVENPVQQSRQTSNVEQKPAQQQNEETKTKKKKKQQVSKSKPAPPADLSKTNQQKKEKKVVEKPDSSIPKVVEKPVSSIPKQVPKTEETTSFIPKMSVPNYNS